MTPGETFAARGAPARPSVAEARALRSASGGHLRASTVCGAVTGFVD